MSFEFSYCAVSRTSCKLQWSTAAACSLNLQHKLQKSTSEQHDPRLRSGSIKVVYKSDIYGYNDVKYNEYDNGEYDDANG